MRVIFIDLHCNGFVLNTFTSLLVKRHIATRHKFLVQGLLKQGVDVYNYVTLNGTTLPSEHWSSKITAKLNYRRKEAEYVLKRNGLDKIKCITTEDKFIFHENDIIIMYSRFDYNQCEVEIPKGIKVIDFTHFYGGNKEAKTIKEANFQYYLCEIDLSKFSKLFNNYFGDFKAEYINRPFAFENRFISKTNFKDRKNKVCSMGNIASLHPLWDIHKDYCMTYRTLVMQPIRKKIYENRRKNTDLIDCYNECQNDEVKKYKIYDSDIKILRKWKWWKNYYSLNRLSNYYRDFDMVEVYNNYKIVVNAEDYNGFYAIGAIEAMACGCALLGQEYGVYEELGLQSGIHYISYDGTIDDLRKKAEYYLQPYNLHKLEIIAKNGMEYVRKHFSENQVFKNYYMNLLSISNR